MSQPGPPDVKPLQSAASPVVPAREPVAAIVTGGSSGVGAAIVAALLQGTAVDKIFVTGQRPFEKTPLQALLVTPEALARVHYSTGDTGDDATVRTQWDEAVAFAGRPPRALFLNAGIGGGRYPLEDFSVERFDAIMRTKD
jgi:NAD(P)-dependent dehydrogenase (short-subunit alcohol dehydrogenase family)